MTSSVEEKILLARCQDAINLCEKQNCLKFVGFLTPFEAELIRRNMVKATIKTDFWGGYPDAERTLFVALPDYIETCVETDIISVIEIFGKDVGTLRHPDFLGSLLGLGIKRDKLGDILILEDRCVVFVVESIADYVAKNLTKVGNKGVMARPVNLEKLEIPERRVERVHVTVAGMRLDCIVAAAAKTSRSGAVEIISNGRVFVNWVQQDSASLKMKPGDVFSIRGVGKFRIAEEVSETKKGRLSVYIEK